MQVHVRTHRLLLVLGVLLCGIWLSGCAPSDRLSKVVRADPAAPLGYVEVSGRDAGIVSVIRQGRRLDPRTPMTLQQGDEIRTGPDSAAVLRFANGGEAVIAPNTHVRLGSLEVFFGRVLADLRGLFAIEDDNIVAAVEGTRFLFESEHGRRTRVAVLEGRVRCSSKSESWDAIPLDAGQQLRANEADARRPRVEPMNRHEIAEIERWSSGIREAARLGFCCARGKVYESLSNDCRGHFEEDRRRAEYQCESGWCCHNGEVSRTIRSDCRGQFHTSQSRAEKACAPPAPAPAVVQGWCCLNGNLKQTDSRYCAAVKGRFYTSASEARRRCLPVVR